MTLLILEIQRALFKDNNEKLFSIENIFLKVVMAYFLEEGCGGFYFVNQSAGKVQP